MEFVIGRTFNVKRTTSPGGNGIRAGAKLKGNTRIVTGYCSIFGNVDGGNDVVVPGAFKKAVADFNAGQSRCRFLWNHNSNEPPIARIIEIKEVSRDQLPTEYRNMVDVSGALQITREYFTDPYSERVYQGVASKAVSEMSFAYNALDFEYKDVGGKKVRLLKSVDLMDASDVNWGMNPATMGSVKGPAVLTLERVKQLKKGHSDLSDLKERIAQLKYGMPLSVRKEMEMNEAMAKADAILARSKEFLRSRS